MRIITTLLVLLLASPSVLSEDVKNTTIVCLVDGETDERNGYSREIKLQQMVTFNPLGVVSFKNDFLSDYDFLESHIWSNGFRQEKLELNNSVTENEIVISVKSSEKYDASSTLLINWIIWDLTINRKSGVAKTEASYSYTIDNTGVRSGLSKDIVMVSYSGFGNCSKSENKF